MAQPVKVIGPPYDELVVDTGHLECPADSRRPQDRVRGVRPDQGFRPRAAAAGKVAAGVRGVMVATNLIADGVRFATGSTISGT